MPCQREHGPDANTSDAYGLRALLLLSKNPQTTA